MKKNLFIITLIILLTIIFGSGLVLANDYKVGFSVSTLSNPFFVTMEEGGSEKAEELDIDLVTLDAQDDASKQVSQIQDLITQKVDVLIVNPVDSDAISVAIQEANRAKIPVITVTRPANNGKVAQHLDVDNKECGEKIAKKLVEDLNEKGNIAILEGLPGAVSTEDRQEGFMKVIDDYENLEVIESLTANYSRSEGNSVAEDIIESNPDLDAIYAHNDEMALGAIRALDGADKLDEVKVYGIDAIDDALEALKNNEMAATIMQQPKLQMEEAVESAHKLIQGEELEEDTVFIPVKLIDENNIDQYVD